MHEPEIKPSRIYTENPLTTYEYGYEKAERDICLWLNRRGVHAQVLVDKIKGSLEHRNE